MRVTNDSKHLLLVVRFLITCAKLVIFLFSCSGIQKGNWPCRLNSEAVIDNILSFDPEIHTLQALVPILLDPTKKSQGLKMMA